MLLSEKGHADESASNRVKVYILKCRDRDLFVFLFPVVSIHCEEVTHVTETPSPGESSDSWRPLCEAETPSVTVSRNELHDLRVTTP